MERQKKLNAVDVMDLTLSMTTTKLTWLKMMMKFLKKQKSEKVVMCSVVFQRKEWNSCNIFKRKLTAIIDKEQYFKLAQIDDLTSSRLIGIIKDTKIGRGLKFLPRKIADLTKNLHVWLEELAETDAYTVRNKISALLEELLQRNGISHDRYTSIKEENDIL